MADPSVLVAGLREALGRVEKQAREALHPDAVQPGVWTLQMCDQLDTDPQPPTQANISEDRQGHYWQVANDVFIPVAQHIATWSPDAVLATVQVLRTLITGYEQTLAEHRSCTRAVRVDSERTTSCPDARRALSALEALTGLPMLKETSRV